MNYRLLLLDLTLLVLSYAFQQRDENIVKKNNDMFLPQRLSTDNGNYTAGNTMCRADHKCGYHSDQSFSWCYTDYSHNWDYCCAGPCQFDGRQYMWCESGSTWQYCGDAGMRDVQGRQCLPQHPCGAHQEDGKKSFYWCYVDLNKNWDKCCQPSSRCSSDLGRYNWCWTSLYTGTDRKYCTPLD